MCSRPCSGRIAIALTQERGKTIGIVCVYLAEILLKLTLASISTRSHKLTFAGKVLERVTILDFEILVPSYSAHFAVHNGAVRFAIAYIILKLCESKYKHPRNDRKCG